MWAAEIERNKTTLTCRTCIKNSFSWHILFNHYKENYPTYIISFTPFKKNSEKFITLQKFWNFLSFLAISLYIWIASVCLLQNTPYTDFIFSAVVLLNWFVQIKNYHYNYYQELCSVICNGVATTNNLYLYIISTCVEQSIYCIQKTWLIKEAVKNCRKWLQWRLTWTTVLPWPFLTYMFIQYKVCVDKDAIMKVSKSRKLLDPTV